MTSHEYGNVPTIGTLVGVSNKIWDKRCFIVVKTVTNPIFSTYFVKHEMKITQIIVSTR